MKASIQIDRITTWPALARGVLVIALLGAGCAHEPETVNYECAGGRTIQVVYPDRQTALVHFASRVYSMRLRPSALGRRYAGDGFQWVTRDSPQGKRVGTLFLSDGSGRPGQRAERCLR